MKSPDLHSAALLLLEQIKGELTLANHEKVITEFYRIYSLGREDGEENMRLKLAKEHL